MFSWLLAFFCNCLCMWRFLLQVYVQVMIGVDFCCKFMFNWLLDVCWQFMFFGCMMSAESLCSNWLLDLCWKFIYYNFFATWFVLKVCVLLATWFLLHFCVHVMTTVDFLLQDYVHLIAASVDFCCRLRSNDLLQVLALISAASWCSRQAACFASQMAVIFEVIICCCCCCRIREFRWLFRCLEMACIVFDFMLLLLVTRKYRASFLQTTSHRMITRNTL